MNHSIADKIARAVLYEGYILYPYRPSVKTRQRWTFGGLYPPAYSEAQDGTDPAVMQTQCLAAGDDHTLLEAEARFLHLVDRTVGQFPQPLEVFAESSIPAFTEVPSLEAGGKVYQPWQEATERTIPLPPFRLGDLANRPVTLEFSFPDTRSLEPIQQDGGGIAGVLARRQQAVQGAIEVSAERMEADGMTTVPAGGAESKIAQDQHASARHPEPSEGSLPFRTEETLRSAQGDGYSRQTHFMSSTDGGEKPRTYRITVTVSNRTPLKGAADFSRDEALLRSLISTHVLLGIKKGRLVSLTDPPQSLRQAAAACRNTGAWPVLVGEPGDADTLLASPIILSDYPQVAPESPGDLFDSTEIDEILTLRIMTLTDKEKREMAGIDERAAALLRRTESLAREQLMALHGTIRTSQPNLREGHNG